MNPQLSSKFSTIKQSEKQKSKSKIKKAKDMKSHIVFAGDPAFQQESFEYVPMGKRKRIFQDKQSNILPPDILSDQEHFMEHKKLLKNQRIINQNISNSYERQFGTVRPKMQYGQQSGKQMSNSHQRREETYFEANNLQADINFGIIQEEEFNPAFNSSKASETTQKKGGINFQNKFPFALNNLGGTLFNKQTQNSVPSINFSYQGKDAPKVPSQMNDDRISKNNPGIRMESSPQKNRSRTIFLNEGGVMVPKAKKIPLHDSAYFDFQGDNESYHEGPMRPQGETPQFPKKNSNIRSNDMINNSLINEFNKLESQSHLREFNQMNIQQGLQNHNNVSVVSYKSIQKQFETDRMEKGKNEVQNLVSPNSSKKPSENPIIKGLEKIGQRELNGQNNGSQSFQQENRQSMFDQLLKDREKIFNKNKVQEEVPVKKVVERQGGSRIKTEVASVAAVASQYTAVTNQYNSVPSHNEHNSLQKPVDFITESAHAPKGMKRNINIKNVAGNEYDKVKHLYKEEENHAAGDQVFETKQPLLESKVRKLDVNEVSGLKREMETNIRKSRISQLEKGLKDEVVETKEGQNHGRKSKFAKELNPHDVNHNDHEQDNASPQVSRKNISEEEHDSEYEREKKRKKRRNKSRKSKVQNDSDLEEYLQKQQTNINLNNIHDYMEHIPQISSNKNINKQGGANPNRNSTNLSKSQKKQLRNSQGNHINHNNSQILDNHNQQSGSFNNYNFDGNESKQSILGPGGRNSQELTPEQRNVLSSMGIKIVGNMLVNQTNNNNLGHNHFSYQQNQTSSHFNHLNSHYMPHGNQPQGNSSHFNPNTHIKTQHFPTQTNHHYKHEQTNQSQDIATHHKNNMGMGLFHQDPSQIHQNILHQIPLFLGQNKQGQNSHEQMEKQFQKINQLLYHFLVKTIANQNQQKSTQHHIIQSHSQQNNFSTNNYPTRVVNQPSLHEINTQQNNNLSEEYLKSNQNIGSAISFKNIHSQNGPNNRPLSFNQNQGNFKTMPEKEIKIGTQPYVQYSQYQNSQNPQTPGFYQEQKMSNSNRSKGNHQNNQSYQTNQSYQNNQNHQNHQKHQNNQSQRVSFSESLPNFHPNNQSQSNKYYQNQSKSNFSKQQQHHLRSSQNNDETRYYSFYNDNPELSASHDDSTQFFNSSTNRIDPNSFYPIKSVVSPKGNQQNSFKNNSKTTAFKDKFDIRNNKKRFSSSQLQILFNKIQQLSQQIHHQLPQIKAQIEQNQQEIRRIETNILIRSTAQQHTLVKILQKMKIKQAQLKQKQLEVHRKDQELDNCSLELGAIREEIEKNSTVQKDLEIETYFENRLQKIKKYNQTLCSKLALVKKGTQKEPVSII